MKNNLAAFFFTSSGLSSEQAIEIVKKSLSQVAKLILSAQRPFIARLDKEGKAEVWLNHKGEDLIAKKQERRRLKKQKSDD